MTDDISFAESIARLTKAGYLDVLLHEQPVSIDKIRKYWLTPRLRDKLEIYFTPLGLLYQQRR